MQGIQNGGWRADDGIGGRPPDRASVLQRIGGTPLVALRRIVPDGCARVLINSKAPIRPGA
jgi:hypothetical protein